MRSYPKKIQIIPIFSRAPNEQALWMHKGSQGFHWLSTFIVHTCSTYITPVLPKRAYSATSGERIQRKLTFLPNKLTSYLREIDFFPPNQLHSPNKLERIQQSDFVSTELIQQPNGLTLCRISSIFFSKVRGIFVVFFSVSFDVPSRLPNKLSLAECAPNPPNGLRIRRMSSSVFSCRMSSGNFFFIFHFV